MIESTLGLLVAVCLSTALLCFLVSSITGNYSQVDKLWSIMPLVYVWIIAYRSGFEERILLMAGLVTLWGIRLSYNFWRRGGYSVRFWDGAEDYRWSILRANPFFKSPLTWVLFNLVFISLYQMGLVLLITLPALFSVGGSPAGWPDVLITGIILALLVIETAADQQQWEYHKRRRAWLEAGETLPPDLKKGFVSHGLWGRVRHPNYSAEQGIWIAFYFFSVSATGEWLNWSVAGAVLLVLLFWGSSNFSEGISASKYPDYAEYRRQVPRFLPVRFRKS